MSITFLAILLVSLVLVSAFFACSETALMSVNKYRLRHHDRMGNKVAHLLLKLLERPDRLLGVILIGNTGANIIASSVATVLCVKIWGGKGVFIATIGLTFIILIFSEVFPKTFAAVHPMSLSRTVAWPIYIMQIILYPIVWTANMIANALLFLIGVRVNKKVTDALTAEEIRSIVHESGQKLSVQGQDMLLGVLDLTEVSVNDIMIPRSEIVGLDLQDDWSDIVKQLVTSQHTRLPVFNGSLDDVRGILHLREVLYLLAEDKLTPKSLCKVLYETYYIPSNTPLSTQLLNFRQIKRRSAIIVDEYGDIQGLVTLEDILEEIVGEFTTRRSELSPEIHLQDDGSFIINGSINIRELNRELNWKLPTNTAKTLSGLVIEYLEIIPKSPLCLWIDDYRIEVMNVTENIIKALRIFPPTVKVLTDN